MSSVIFFQRFLPLHRPLVPIIPFEKSVLSLLYCINGFMPFKNIPYTLFNFFVLGFSLFHCDVTHCEFLYIYPT